MAYKMKAHKSIKARGVEAKMAPVEAGDKYASIGHPVMSHMSGFGSKGSARHGAGAAMAKSMSRSKVGAHRLSSLTTKGQHGHDAGGHGYTGKPTPTSGHAGTKTHGADAGGHGYSKAMPSGGKAGSGEGVSTRAGLHQPNSGGGGYVGVKRASGARGAD
jgi:hypothetical protein